MSSNIPTSNLSSDLPLFARRLKQARLAAGLSQERLGVAAGVDEFSASARLNQYERGKHTPDVLTATHLARVLKVPLAYFWASDDEAQLLCAFHALTGEEREQVLALAVALMPPPAKPHH